MNAVRSCYAAAVPLMVVLGWHAGVADRPSERICCGGSDDGSAACPRTGNRSAFQRIEAFGETLCADVIDGAAAKAVRKCCPPAWTHDPDESLACRPANPDATTAAFRAGLLSLPMFRNPTAVGYDYEPPKCADGSVLVDVPVDDAVGPPGRSAAAAPDFCLDLRWTSPADGEPEEELLVARACRPRETYCSPRGRYTCANKCCMVGKMLVNSKCVKSKTPPGPFRMLVHELDDGVALIPSNNTPLPYYERLQNCFQRYRLDDDSFRLFADGTLYRMDTGQRVPATAHCLQEHAAAAAAADGQAESRAVEAYVCAAADQPREDAVVGSWKYVVLAAGLVPSIVCLVFTLIVYVVLSGLRNVHGYYVMSYVACLLLSYVCLLIVQWLPDVLGSGLCKFFGYLTLFAFLATFCWLNVICFDIYWMLKYNNSINRNTSVSIRTVLYNIYCWGFSSVCVTTGFLFQQSKTGVLKEFAPNIGINSCWFTTIDYGNIIFFIVPVASMLIFNLILFVLTAVHCSKIKSELSKFNRSNSTKQRFRVEKDKFVMSIKLFLVMGIPWSFEILSKIYGNGQHLWLLQLVWAILDEINALQGVMIFIIFVAKPKVISNLRRRFGSTMDHSESTRVNTISGSSYSGSARKSFNDF